MKKTKIIWIAVAVVLVVFLGLSMKVIDKGTEGQYTGEVAFDAGASSSSDWDAILAEITAGAQELSTLDLSALGFKVETGRVFASGELYDFNAVGTIEIPAEALNAPELEAA